MLLPKCSGDLKYGPCPPARDWGSRVSGLVLFFFRVANIFPYDILIKYAGSIFCLRATFCPSIDRLVVSNCALSKASPDKYSFAPSSYKNGILPFLSIAMWGAHLHTAVARFVSAFKKFLISSQIYQHETVFCVASLNYKMKILDLWDRFNWVILKNVDEDCCKSQHHSVLII